MLSTPITPSFLLAVAMDVFGVFCALGRMPSGFVFHDSRTTFPANRQRYPHTEKEPSMRLFDNNRLANVQLLVRMAMNVNFY